MQNPISDDDRNECLKKAESCLEQAGHDVSQRTYWIQQAAGWIHRARSDTEPAPSSKPDGVSKMKTGSRTGAKTHEISEGRLIPKPPAK